MAFQPCPNGIECVVKATQNGVAVVNVYHVKMAGSPTDADLIAVADVIREWYVTTWLPNKHPSYVLTDVIATDISVENGHQEHQVLTTGNAGTAVGAAAGGQVAAVMSWRTANIGRSFRGRTYQGGLTTANLVDAQNLSSGQIAYMVTAGSTLIDNLEAIGAILSVISRVAHGVERVAAILTQIVAVVVNSTVDTQRRRTAN